MMDLCVSNSSYSALPEKKYISTPKEQAVIAMTVSTNHLDRSPHGKLSSFVTFLSSELVLLPSSTVSLSVPITGKIDGGVGTTASFLKLFSHSLLLTSYIF
jgi:hypothetical protein